MKVKSLSVKRLAWWALYSGVATHLPSWWRPAKKFRVACASRFCTEVDRTANINRRARLGWATVIKPHGGVGEYSILSGEIRLGHHVTMGPHCYFITGDHPIPPDFGRFRDMHSVRKPITVEDDVFIGARVTVLPGVTIGRGAAVGAGAVVAKDVAPGAIVVGNPAREIRRRVV